MPEKKTLNEDLFYKGSSANLPRLHTCKNKVPFWDFSQFAVTIFPLYMGSNSLKKITNTSVILRFCLYSDYSTDDQNLLKWWNDCLDCCPTFSKGFSRFRVRYE